jgi:hypothetical protein
MDTQACCLFQHWSTIMRNTNPLVLGSIVLYGTTPYIALGYTGNLVKIISPVDGDNTKLNVSRNKLTVTSFKATVVEYKNKQHVVTNKGTIISMISLRVLKSTTTDGKAIIAQAHSS